MRLSVIQMRNRMMILMSVFLCPKKGNGLGLSGGAIKLKRVPLFRLWKPCICISKHHLFRIIFGIKMQLKDGWLLPRLLGNLKSGIFSTPHSPLLLLIYLQPLCRPEHCKKCSWCYNWTVLNFSSIATYTKKKTR